MGLLPERTSENPAGTCRKTGKRTRRPLWTANYPLPYVLKARVAGLPQVFDTPTVYLLSVVMARISLVL